MGLGALKIGSSLDGLAGGLQRRGISSWNPAQLGASAPMAWYDSSDAATITQAVAGFVSQWGDKSGNGRHIVQATPANQPAYAAGSGVTFNGSSSYLSNALPFMYANNQIAIYAVITAPNQMGTALLAEASTTNNNPVYAPLWSKQGVTGPDLALNARNDAGATMYSAANGGDGTFLNNTKKLVRVYDDGEFVHFYDNGALSASIRPYTRSGSLSLSNFTMGAFRRNAVSSYFNGTVHELIVAKNDDNGWEYEGYLAWKRGLQASLPAYHPYRAKAPAKNAQANTVRTFNMPGMRFKGCGDSITDLGASGGQGNSFSKLYSNGHYGTIGNLSKGRFRCDPANEVGQSGKQTADIKTQVLAQDAATYDIMGLLAGINNVKQGGSAGPAISDIAQMLIYAALISNKPVILLGLGPIDSWNAGYTQAQIDSARAVLKQINRWIAKQAGKWFGQVYPVDIYPYLQVADIPIANDFYDQLHPDSAGSHIIATQALAQTQAYLGTAAFDFTVGALNANPLLTGTGGTKDGTVTGDVATGFALTGTTGTGTRTASKLAGDLGQQIVVNLAGTTATDATNLTLVQTGGFTNGDVVYGAIEIDLSTVTPQGIYDNSLSLVLSGPNPPYTAAAYGNLEYDDTSLPVLGHKPVCETYISRGKLIIFTPDLVIAGNVTTLTLKHNLAGTTTAETKAATAKITGMGIYKRSA